MAMLKILIDPLRKFRSTRSGTSKKNRASVRLDRFLGLNFVKKMFKTNSICGHSPRVAD